MHWRNCLIIRLLHSIVKRSNARWRLSVTKIRWSNVFRNECRNAAFDVDVIKCTLTIISMSRLHSMSMSSNVLTKLFDVKKTAFNFERLNTLTICLFCCLLLNDKADKLLTRSKCWFVAFNRFISLIWLQKIW